MVIDSFSPSGQRRAKRHLFRAVGYTAPHYDAWHAGCCCAAGVLEPSSGVGRLPRQRHQRRRPGPGRVGALGRGDHAIPHVVQPSGHPPRAGRCRCRGAAHPRTSVGAGLHLCAARRRFRAGSSRWRWREQHQRASRRGEARRHPSRDRNASPTRSSARSAHGDADPAALRKSLGHKVRSLGEEGKKRGVTTTLPLALGVLQAQSRIRRVPIDGRLDQQRFRYTVWRSAPTFSGSPEEARAELARKYWGWIGLASLANFQWFSGFTKTNATKAVATLGLERLADTTLLGTQATLTEFAGFAAPKQPQVSLIGWLDSLVLLRRDLDSLTDEGDRAHPLLDPARGSSAGGSLTDLPNQGIVDRGRLIGLWDYDPATEDCRLGAHHENHCGTTQGDAGRGRARPRHTSGKTSGTTEGCRSTPPPAVPRAWPHCVSTPRHDPRSLPATRRRNRVDRGTRRRPRRRPCPRAFAPARPRPDGLPRLRPPHRPP
jgi:hypothetical protein